MLVLMYNNTKKKRIKIFPNIIKFDKKKNQLSNCTKSAHVTHSNDVDKRSVKFV